MTCDEGIIVKIVEKIAKAEGVEPLDLEYPLYNYIDTSAITALDNHDGSRWKLGFTVEGHWVTVDSAGAVEVDPTTA